MIREIPAFSQGLTPPLEITDDPQVKNHWSKQSFGFVWFCILKLEWMFITGNSPGFCQVVFVT